MNRRFCLTLDMKDDPKLIAEYRKYHKKIWPEVTASLKDSGIEDAEIYLFGTRMFMILEANELKSPHQLFPFLDFWICGVRQGLLLRTSGASASGGERELRGGAK